MQQRKKLIDINGDRVGDWNVVVFVLNKESAIWTESSMKAVVRRALPKYIDLMVTNNRVDKNENIATGCVNI